MHKQIFIPHFVGNITICHLTLLTRLLYKNYLSSVLTVVLCFCGMSLTVAANEDYTIDSDKILVTVVLKHQRDKSLTELQQKMDENRFWRSFLP